MAPISESATDAKADYSTIEVARMLGLAVRSVQLMVDRGELDAWKTPGGHRRISRASVERWLAARPTHANTLPAPLGPAADEPTAPRRASARAGGGPTVLLIEDSRHYQNIVRLLLGEDFPEVRLEVADDGIAGLAMAGRLQPDIILIDILLPGIDGATLIMGLRSHDVFAATQLIVITSLGDEDLKKYAFALQGIPVVHKPELMHELPAALRTALDQVRQRARGAP